MLAVFFGKFYKRMRVQVVYVKKKTIPCFRLLAAYIVYVTQ